jgi:hypothetical protein
LLHAGSLKKIGKATLQLGLVTPGYESCRVSGEVGKLDDEPGESGARPSWSVGPDSELSKHACHDRFGRSRKSVAKGLKRLEREVVLGFQNLGEQLILAVEMMIERALRDCGRDCDLIHRDAIVALSAKELVGALKDTFACLFRGSRHEVAPSKYTP